MMDKDEQDGLEQGSTRSSGRPVRKGRLQALEEAKSAAVSRSLRGSGLDKVKGRVEVEKAVVKGELSAEQLREKAQGQGVTDDLLISWLKYMADPEVEDPRYDAAVKLRATEKLCELVGLLGREKKAGGGGYGNITFVFAPGGSAPGGATINVKAE